MQQVKIYGREDCAFCIRAIHTCLHKGLSFSFVNITETGISKADLANMLQQPVETVPQILIGEQYIGGSDDLEKFFRNHIC